MGRRVLERKRPRQYRRRGPASGESGRFKKGHNSHTDQPFRRGKDLIPRKGMHALFELLAEADGATVKAIEQDRNAGFRVLLAKQYVKAAKGKSPKLAMQAAQDLADRLEGKPTQTVNVRERRTTVFQGPPPAEEARSVVPGLMNPEEERRG